LKSFDFSIDLILAGPGFGSDSNRSTSNLTGGDGRPVRMATNLTTICGAYRLWERFHCFACSLIRVYIFTTFKNLGHSAHEGCEAENMEVLQEQCIVLRVLISLIINYSVTLVNTIFP
jgi:hypothetical protein